LKEERKKKTAVGKEKKKTKQNKNGWKEEEKNWITRLTCLSHMTNRVTMHTAGL